MTFHKGKWWWLVTKLCPTLETLWTVAHQAPLSVGFSRQELWGDLPFPPPGDLLKPGIKPGSPALQADSLPTELPGKPKASCRNPGMSYTIRYWIYFFTTCSGISNAETEYICLLRSFKTSPLWLRGRCCSVYFHARKLSPWTWSEEKHSA